MYAVFYKWKHEFLDHNFSPIFCTDLTINNKAQLRMLLKSKVHWHGSHAKKTVVHPSLINLIREIRIFSFVVNIFPCCLHSFLVLFWQNNWCWCRKIKYPNRQIFNKSFWVGYTCSLAWPHFCRTVHQIKIFAQEFELASYFCDWTFVDLIMS